MINQSQNDLSNIRMMKKIKKLKLQNILLENKIIKYKKLLENTMLKIQNLNTELELYKNTEINWFIKDCIINQFIQKNHRKYTNEMLMFCEALYITSPKAYKL